MAIYNPVFTPWMATTRSPTGMRLNSAVKRKTVCHQRAGRSKASPSLFSVSFVLFEKHYVSYNLLRSSNSLTFITLFKKFLLQVKFALELQFIDLSSLPIAFWRTDGIINRIKPVIVILESQSLTPFDTKRNKLQRFWKSRILRAQVECLFWSFK